MAMRVSGINSGLDTDAIVQELVSAYSKKSEKYTKEQTKLGWKQEIWKDLNKKVYNLYTSVSNLKYSSAYASKKVSCSDSTKASVSASGNAVVGTQRLNVIKTAQAGYLTGGKLTTASGTKAKYDTTLRELGFTGDASLRVKMKDKNGEDVVKQIKLSGESTLSDVTSKLQEAGLSASFDENNGRIFISSKTSGADGDFTIDEAETRSVPKTDADGNLVFGSDGNPVYEDVALDADEKAAGRRLLGVLGLSANSAIKTGAAIQTTSGKAANAGSTMQDLGIREETTINVTRTVNGTPVSFAITVNANTKLSSVIDQLNQNGVNAGINGQTGKLYFQDPEADLAFSVGSGNADAVKKLGLDSALTADTSLNAIKIEGRDAKIRLNGVEYTNSSNNFEINGLNINAHAETGDGDENAIEITTSIDTQGIYDKVKEFLTQYNSVINEITKLYNADTAKDYEPLTDEEKDKMSDTEVEKWETKIKDSLLRRDNSLSSIMTAMTTAMSTGITINGKSYSLSTFGIETLGYLNAAKNEQNAYHIDGDEDDENTSSKKDKLMAAITEDPDTVVDFMKQLSTNLYTAIDKQMQGNSLRSRFKIYNDKELDKQYSNYTKIIKEWDEKISTKEDYYYKKFSQMETALSKINGQQSSISGLLGSK